MTSDPKPQRWSFTRNFSKKRGQRRFLERLNRARTLFPELEGKTVRLGITINTEGKADLENMAVYFRSRNISTYVMGHELTHLLQAMGLVPQGERSCDIFTLARNEFFCDRAPHYVDVPKRLLNEDETIKMRYRSLVHETAKTALELRAAGKKQYISWFEKELGKLAHLDHGEVLVMGKQVKITEELWKQTALEDFFSPKHEFI